MFNPNFFIIGAPKCGTTAMATYLSQHPDVFISNPKEPLYFLHPTSENRKVVDKDHYLRLFNHAAGCAAIGEASVWYLYSNHALKAIHEFNPEARIIIMTRNPVDFVASLHSQLVFDSYETEKNLYAAWSREKNRVLDGSEETIEQVPGWQGMYAELMQHHKYIARYLEVFGEKNILLLTNEQMVRDVRGAYTQVLSFLGVEDDGRTDFPRVNSNKAPKSEAVQRFLKVISEQQWAVRSARNLKARLGIGSFGLYRAIRNANITEVSRQEPPECLKREIEAAAAGYRALNQNG